MKDGLELLYQLNEGFGDGAKVGDSVLRYCEM